MKKVFIVFFIMLLTSCSPKNKDVVITINNLEAEVLQVVNYYNEDHKLNNYLMALKLSNHTLQEVDISDIETSFNLRAEGFEPLGTIMNSGGSLVYDSLLAKEDKVIVLEFKFISGQGDRSRFGFSFQNEDYLFSNLINQNIIEPNFKSDDTVLYDSTDSKVDVSFVDAIKKEFIPYSLAVGNFSIENTKGIYTNKTNEYLFVPLIKNQGRLSLDNKREKIKLYELQINHKLKNDSQNINIITDDFILLEPKQELIVDISNSLTVYDTNYKKLSEDVFTLDLDYFVLNNVNNSLNLLVKDLVISDFVENNLVLSNTIDKQENEHDSDSHDDYSKEDLIKIPETDFAIIANDKAMGQTQWFFVSYEEDKINFISELPKTSPYVKADIDDEGVIHLQFEDYSSNIFKYISKDYGETWIET